MKPFATLFEQALRKCGTYNDLIKRLGVKVSRAYITKIKLHSEIPSPDLIIKIADILKMDRLKLLDIARMEKLNEYLRVLNEKYDKALKEAK